MALEATGENALPGAFAGFCAAVVDGVHSQEITQVNKVYHTGATAMERLLTRPMIDGLVKVGSEYVIVDDVTILGGTLAEVSDHIQ